MSIIIGCIILGLSYFFAQQYYKRDIVQFKNNKQSDYFYKKIECEKYKDKIQEKINQYNLSQVPEVRDSNNAGGEPINNLYIENNLLKELFYSPKLDSCLCLESRRTLMKKGLHNDESQNWITIYETYYLVDVLTGKEINFNNDLNFLQIIHRGERFSTIKQADDIINEYK